MSHSNSTEQLSASINSGAGGGSSWSHWQFGQQHWHRSAAWVNPKEQHHTYGATAEDSIATAGLEQHGPSKQQQNKKGKRTKMGAAIDTMLLPRAPERLMREMDEVWRKRTKFEEKRSRGTMKIECSRCCSRCSCQHPAPWCTHLLHHHLHHMYHTSCQAHYQTETKMAMDSIRSPYCTVVRHC